jgi:cAMP phosphodiesterase
MKTYAQLKSQIHYDRSNSRSKDAIQRLLVNDVNPDYDDLDDDELRAFWREVAEYATTLQLSIGVCT